jgi:hypothetical protein
MKGEMTMFIKKLYAENGSRTGEEGYNRWSARKLSETTGVGRRKAMNTVRANAQVRRGRRMTRGGFIARGYGLNG